MPRVHPLEPTFNAGELSPRLAARLDFVKYPAGVETMENIVALPEGGAMRRAGGRYIAGVSDHDVKHRLKRFQFSVIQAYMLELGAQKMRFFRHQGQITVPDTDAAISNGTFDSNITGWDDISTGTGSIAHDSTNNDLDLVPGGTGGSDIGIAEQDVTTTATGTEHVIKFRVVGDPGDKIDFRIGTSSGGEQILADVTREVGYHCVSFTPTASPFYVQFRNFNDNKTVSIDDVSLIDNAPVEIDTPWLESELFEVEGPQSADVLYLFHGEHPTHKLLRFGNTTWSLVEVPWQDGPYLDMNTTATTLNPGSSSGVAVTVTASSTIGINGGDGFQTTDIGRLLRIRNGSTWGWGVIVARSSTTAVSVHVKKDFAAATADTRWRLGSWSETTGYPQVAGFFEQRLYVAATTDQPQTFWGSQTADFENFKPDDNTGTVEADDAFAFTLSADDVNAIRWLSAGEDTIVIGTAGGEWVPGSEGAVITPLDITVRQQTTHGSARIQPVRVGNTVLFVQRAKRRVREFGFSFESDGYKAPDMTRLAAHITRGGIVEMTYQQEPDSVVWSVRGDGTLLSMTFRRDEDVVGWGRHIFGGAFSGGDPVCESVAVIPGSDGAGQTQDSSSRDEVWVIVKRTINGATKRYVEMLERDLEEGDDQEDAYYADALITYDGAAATVITGLDHLEGETVKVWGDGAVFPVQTVASGQITLDSEVSVAQIGLGYRHRLKTLKVRAGNPAGTPLGKLKRIYGLTFALLNSHTLSFGPELDEMTDVDFRVVSDAMDAAAPLFTGERGYEFPGGWVGDARIIIESDDPAPFTLLAMAPEISVNALR